MKTVFENGKVEKFIVAGSAWAARKLLRRIEEGKAPVELLFDTELLASKKMRRLSRDRQKNHGIFKVEFKPRTGR